MRRTAILPACGVTVLSIGCPLFPGGTVCTAIFVYGLNVTVTDGEGNAVTGATLTLREGDYNETMMELGVGGDPGVYVGAGERAGTYSLSIEADGFNPATINNITITADECHVIPVNLTVPLQPA